MANSSGRPISVDNKILSYVQIYISKQISFYKTSDYIEVEKQLTWN